MKMTTEFPTKNWAHGINVGVIAFALKEKKVGSLVDHGGTGGMSENSCNPPADRLELEKNERGEKEYIWIFKEEHGTVRRLY